jgi:hypothetical protein
MAFPPDIPREIFNFASNLVSPRQQSTLQTFSDLNALSSVQGRLPNNRSVVNARKMMHFILPTGDIVQMYINPQNIQYSNKKLISNQRTKSGYVLQYWGEELGELSISGTTGTSGIEGINVLQDVYRFEQLALDPYALTLAAKNYQDNFSSDIFNSESAFQGQNSFVDFLLSAQNNPQITPQNLPSLAQYAFTIEIFWSGEIYRGYFNNFSVTESSGNLGLFDYSFNFTVTQKRGFRQNFLAWHRSPLSGPSNSNPIHGRPYSLSHLVSSLPTAQSV